MLEAGLPAITFPRTFTVAFEGYLAVSAIAPNEELARLNAQCWLEENGKRFGVDPAQLFLPSAVGVTELHDRETTALLTQCGRSMTQHAEDYSRTSRQPEEPKLSRKFKTLDDAHYQQLGIPFS